MAQMYFDKYVNKNPQEMESNFMRLEDGTIIDINQIVEDGIRDIQHSYENEDGTINSFTRKQYEFADGKIMEVPISVHAKIMILYNEYKSEGQTITRFKVRKSGESLRTKYDVLPLIGKNASKDYGADEIVRPKSSGE